MAFQMRHAPDVYRELANAPIVNDVVMRSLIAKQSVLLHALHERTITDEIFTARMRELNQLVSVYTTQADDARMRTLLAATTLMRGIDAINVPGVV